MGQRAIYWQASGRICEVSFDITHALQEGENILVVKVEDTYDVRQPRGKQRWKKYNYGCWYVQTTGIWKTVWLESMSSEHIKKTKITPDLEKKEVELEVEFIKGEAPLRIETRIEFDGVLVNTSSAQVLIII